MASTLTPAKSWTSTVPLFTCQTVSSNTQAKGPEQDVSTKWAGTALVRLGRTSSAAVTNATEIRIETSGRGTSPAADFWIPIIPWTTAKHATAAAQSALSVAANSAQAKVDVVGASITGFSASDGLLFLYDNATASRSEWFRVVSLATACLTALDNLVRTHTAANTVLTDQAEEWAIPIDLSALQTIRMVVDNAVNAVAGTIVVEGQMVFQDAVAAT